jgi:phosphoribosyl 1,2-cyclic phosphate phosphodiesterase
MRVTFLGTGPSHGIPVIGCDCAVCLSSNPKNRRNRIGAWLHEGPAHVGRDLTEHGRGQTPEAGPLIGTGSHARGLSAVIDVSSEFRTAALANGLKHLDFVLLTHPHSDHASGLDDLRIFSQASGNPMPIYADALTLAEVRRRYAYAFDSSKNYGGGVPQYDLRPAAEPFLQGTWKVTPLPVFHGPEPILGYRVGDFAFITDVTLIPEATLDLLEGLDVLALDCLRPGPHSTHLHYDLAVEYARRIGARRTFMIHMTHDFDHDELEGMLPEGMHAAFDGLTVEIAENPLRAAASA